MAINPKIVKAAWGGIVVLLFLFVLHARRHVDNVKPGSFKAKYHGHQESNDVHGHGGITVADHDYHHKAQKIVNSLPNQRANDAFDIAMDQEKADREAAKHKKPHVEHEDEETAKPVLPSPETREKLQDFLDHNAPADRFVLNEHAEKYPTIAEWQNGAEEGEYLGMEYHVVSKQKPRAMLIERVLTDEDSAALIDIANRSMARSEVVHAPGTSGVNQVRTSYGMFINGRDERHPANIKLRQQAADLVGINIANVEGTQILRYYPGQFYKSHPDYFARGSEHLSRGGQRFATLLTWLNQPGLKSGGKGAETRFEMANVEVKPRKNGAVLFYSMDRDGEVDPYSQHEARPPAEGDIKWVAVCWIRQHEFH